RFSSDGASWKGDGTFRAGPDEARSALADIESEGAQLTFSATIDRAAVLFEGQLVGDQITGRFHVREGGKTVDEGEWSAARGAAQAPELSAADARLAAGETPLLVAAAADALRKRYVDATRGDALASAIEANLASGAYGSITDARVLADQLGRDLFAIAG